MKLYYAVVTTCLLTGCLAEDKKDAATVPVNNEQGQLVTTPTVSLNGFWDGGFDQQDDMRLLIFNGNVYARNATSGFYGTVELDNDLLRATMSLDALVLSANSSDTDRQWVADGVRSDYSIDELQLYTLEARNDALQGTASVNGLDSRLLLLQRDGTWSSRATLAKLVRTGVWESNEYRLVTNNAINGVSFQGNSTTPISCTFSGFLQTLNTNNNLYAVTLNKRSSCPAFNDTSATGYAGFNAEGDLAFYLRNSSNELLFMTFTPPALPEPTPEPGPEPEPTPEPEPAPE